jgi:RNA polymerase sigma factor (TIGR02999 family)
LLREWSGGDSAALEQLVPLVYADLHRMAHNYMRKEKPGQTLQTTALVNQAYLRLAEAGTLDWRDRAHFFAVSSQIMRRLLVDAARARVTLRRGGNVTRVNLDEVPDLSDARDREVIEVDEALEALAHMDPRKARVIELRFFGGLSVEESAAVLSVSPDTVMRDWKTARAWLMRDLKRRS